MPEARLLALRPLLSTSADFSGDAGRALPGAFLEFGSPAAAWLSALSELSSSDGAAAACTAPPANPAADPKVVDAAGAIGPASTGTSFAGGGKLASARAACR